MPKQLNVNMTFTADVSQAQRAMASLGQQLSNLSKVPSLSKMSTPLTKEMLEAKQTAAELKTNLESAFNVDTGKLDLNKFSSNLTKSGKTLSQVQSQLSSLGPEGSQAFFQIATSIVNTQTPLRRTNSMLQDFMTTLKNTARWQISSSILHGFMGALSSAYGYAQDLNESLNNIRIVTGYNVNKMSEFAKVANQAAQALNTTTTKYSDASLIYYQQGLNDKEVLARTNATIKMANVTGDAVTTVSDQLTAVWNNFADGSKTLEYYADVMTALGAATASSTDEIADGLQKFSAVANTVGLSYEYATSALATVTAETRQSADVVGTAFKTLFARLEGLSLGETLEDGTDLNKYSTALQKVGIDIKDASGSLRAMDGILDDLGAKWQSLTKDQQVALAQTVGGVRQYNQLISLMDNWDKMQNNVTIAKTSGGTLDKQANIYAESWEASKTRVKSAMEEIYSSLIDEDFFMDLNDKIFVPLLHGISGVIKGLNGIPGVLSVIGVFLTGNLIGPRIAEAIDNLFYNITRNTSTAQQNLNDLRKTAYDASMTMLNTDPSNSLFAVQREGLTASYNASLKLSSISKNLSDDQKRLAEETLVVAAGYQQMAEDAAKAYEAAKLLQAQNLESKQARANNVQETAEMGMASSGTDLVNASYSVSRELQKNEIPTQKIDTAREGYTQAQKKQQNAIDEQTASKAKLEEATHKSKVSEQELSKAKEEAAKADQKVIEAEAQLAKLRAQDETRAKSFGTAPSASLATENAKKELDAAKEQSETGNKAVEAAQNVHNTDMSAQNAAEQAYVDKTLAVANAQAEVTKTGNTLSDATLQGSQALQEQIALLPNLNDYLHQCAMDSDSCAVEVQDLSQQYLDGKISLEEYKKGLEEIQTAQGDGGAPDELINGLKALGEAENQTDEASKKLATSLKKNIRTESSLTSATLKRSKSQAAVNKEENKTLNGVKKVGEAQDDLRKRIAGTVNANKDYVGSVVKTVVAEKTLEQAAKKAIDIHKQSAEMLNNLGSKYKTLGGTITGGIGAISSFGMALSALKGAYNTLSNPNVSGFEKLIAVMSSGTMIIGGFTRGWSALKDVYNSSLNQILSITAAKIGLTAANVTEATTSELVTAATADGVSQDAAKIGSLALLIVAKKAGIAVDQNTFKAENQGILISQIKQAINKKELTGIWAIIAGKLVKTTATEAETGATIALETASVPLLLITLAIVAAIGILVAIIYLFVQAVKAAEAASPEGQLKAAQEQAAKMAEELDAAREALTELTDAFDKLKSAEDKLAACTKGTAEWRAALQEVNTEVLDLINKYPELGAAVTVDKKTGQLSIDETAKANALQKAQDSVQAMQAASTLANLDVIKKQNVVNESNIKQEIIQESYSKNNRLYEKTGSDERARKDITNQAISILTEHSSELSKLDDDNYTEEVTELLKTELFKGVVDASDKAAIEKFVTQSISYRDSLGEITTANELFAIQVQETTKALAAAILGPEFFEKNNTEQADAATAVTARALKENEEIIYQDILKQAKLDTQMATNTTTSDDLLERYNLATGKHYGTTNNTVQGNANNRTYNWVDTDDPTNELDPMKIEDIARVIASYEAINGAELANGTSIESAQEIAQNAVNVLLEQAKTGNEAGLSGLVSEGNLDSLTSDELTALKAAAYDDDGNFDAESFQKDFLKLSDQELEALFGKDYNLEEIFAGPMEDLESGFQSITDGLTTSQLAAFNNIKTVNMNLTQQKQLVDLLHDAYANQGTEGLQAVQDLFDGLDPDQAAELSTVLSSIDWQTTDVTSLRKAFVDAGVSVNYTDNELQILIDSLYNTGKAAAYAAASLDKATAQYNTIVKAKEDMEDGNIAKEIYEELIKMNPEFKNMFVLLADGTYQLIGSMVEAEKLLKEAEIQGFKNVIDTRTHQNEKIDEVQEMQNQGVDISNLQLKQQSGPPQGTDNDFAIMRALTALEAINYGADDEAVMSQFNEWQSAFSSGEFTAEMASAVEAALQDNAAAFSSENLQALEDANNEEIATAEMAIGTNVSTLNELDTLQSVDGESQAASLLKLASAYESCTDEANTYREAYAAMNSPEAVQAQQNLTDAAGRYYKVLTNPESSDKDRANALKAYNIAKEKAKKYTDNLTKAEQDLRKAIKKEEWRKALTDISENIDALETLEKQMKDITPACQKIANSFNDAFNTKITANFVKENIELFKKWKKASGKEAQEIAIKLSELAKLSDIKVKLEEAGDEKSVIVSKYEEIKSAIENSSIKYNAESGTVDFTELFNNLQALGLDAEGVAEVLASLGYTDIEMLGDVDTEKLKEFQKQMQNAETASTPKERSTAYTNAFKALEGMQVGMHVKDGQIPDAEDVDMENLSDKSGGGGGGGSDEPADHSDKIKSKSDEIERYHEITNTIEDLEKIYNRLHKARERAYGESKLKLIEQEVEATRDLVDAQKQYLGEIQAYLAFDQSKISGFGATFDEMGNINNYDELVSGWVDAFNSQMYLGASDETVEAAEKLYEAQTEALSQYEETHDLWMDEWDKLTDLQYQIVDLQLEGITYEVEYQVILSEQAIERLEYELEKLTRSRTLNINLQVDNEYGFIEEYEKQSEKMRTAIQKIFDSAQENGLVDLTEAQWEAMNDYKSQMLEFNLSAMDKITEVEDKMQEAVDEILEKYDTNISRFDSYSSTLEHYNTIIESSGRILKDYNLNMDLLSQRLTIATSKINTAKKEYEFLSKALIENQKQLEDAQLSGDEENILYWQEQVDNMTVAAEEAYDEFLSIWEEALSTAADIFTSKVEAILNKFSHGIWDVDLTTMSDIVEKSATAAERYLNTTTRLYELSKLNRELEKELDSTDNLVAKKRLLDFQKKINEYQQDGVEMSEYELNFLRSQYEVELAKIALEEARNAKNQVRLSRDSAGNWGYIYTADEDKIAEAEQNYEDKLQEMQVLSQEHLDEMSSLIVSNENELVDALKDIDVTREDYKEEVDRVTRFYLEQELYYRKQLDQALADSNKTYENTIFSALGQTAGFVESYEEYVDKVKGSVNELLEAYEIWQSTVDTAYTEAGISEEDFTESATSDLNNISNATDLIKQAMLDYTDKVNTNIAEVITSIRAWRDEYLQAIADMMKANEEAQNLTYKFDPNGYISDQARIDNIPNVSLPSWVYENPLSYNSSSGSSSSGSSSCGSSSCGSESCFTLDKFLKRDYTSAEKAAIIEEYGGGDSKAITFYHYDSQCPGGGYIYSWKLTQDKKPRWSQSTSTVPDDALIVFVQTGLTGAATGGLTASWGPEGKAAILHENELILNAAQTDSLLNNLDFIKDIFIPVISNLRVADTNLTKSALEQKVEITAEFPNVTNHSEIEEALINLVNTAAQYT